jgi:hypothetical protein
VVLTFNVIQKIRVRRSDARRTVGDRLEFASARTAASLLPLPGELNQGVAGVEVAGIDWGLAGRVDGVKQENPMNELKGAAQNEQSVLIFDVSDEAIESAAGSVWGKSAAVTLAFCSGLDTCPSVQA